MQQSSAVQLKSEMKEHENRSPKLGTILCRDCGGFIDELDTNRVIVFYSSCGQENCGQTQRAEAE